MAFNVTSRPKPDVGEAIGTTIGVLLGCGLAMLFLPAYILVVALLNGFALSKLWEWFVVHQFHVQSLPLWVAIGICEIAGLLTYQNVNARKGKDDQDRTAWNLLYPIFQPLFILGIGWVVYSYGPTYLAGW